MRRITLVSAGLALLAGVVAADAQGIGYAPGVNPSNPQDLTNRSNPQNLLAPGGSNPQDLVRPGVSVTPLGRTRATSVPTPPSSSSTLQYTVKMKPKKKKTRHHRSSAAQR